MILILLVLLPVNINSFISNTPLIRTRSSTSTSITTVTTMHASLTSGGGDSPVERLIHKLRSQGIGFSLVPTDTSSYNSGTESCKTLIWEATTVSEERFYFATALRMKDRIDEERLLLALTRTDVAGLRMADKTIAESLTGFQSGTIPPFGHKIPLAVYVDEQLLHLDMLRTGSGTSGYDFQIELSEMMQFCKATSSVSMHSITVRDATSEGGIVSTTAETDEQPANEKRNGVSDIPEQKGASDMRKQHKLPTPLPESWQDKNLAKRLRDVAWKERYQFDQIKECVEEAGDDLMSLMFGGENGNYTKTPVHNAAWRGTTEVLDLFIETGKRLGEDLINIKAIGEGNYGKTPIFYALTRSREEMVNHCLDLGADLLIVNNKGQTPCSIAASHLSEQTCHKMHRIEEEQLRAGRSFQNFRVSNSDLQKYGDLDPRFLLDEVNMGDDIKEGLDEYQRILDQLPRVNDLPVGNDFARSLRKTNEEIRDSMACERWGKTPKLKYLVANRQAVPKPKKKHNEPAPVIDVTSFDVLEIHNVLDAPANIVVVDSLETIERLSMAVDESILAIKEAAQQSTTMTVTHLAYHSWGLDSEWRPKALSDNQDNPISVLQLSSRTESFVIDVMELCQRCSGRSELPMTTTELCLSEILSKLFEATDIALVGFGVVQDLSKLAFSYPHMPCFRNFESVIDFQSVARSVLGGQTKKGQVNSLQLVVAMMLKKRMDKTEQCSDWEGTRPLRQSQTNYAALDAAVPRYLLLEAFRQNDFNFDFFQRYAHLRQNIRMTVLMPEEEHDKSICHRVEMGNERTSLGIRLAKQVWSTGKEAPPLPSRLHAEEIDQPRKLKPDKKKSGRKNRLRARSIPLRTLAGNLEALPPAGVHMGYTKDSCAEAVLGDAIVNSIADDFSLRFNRRGGIVEMSNCWLLFINLSGHTKEWKYRNHFSDLGHEVNFSINTLNGFKENDLSFLFDVGCLGDSLEYIPKIKEGRAILLFARSSSNSKFINCGKCNCLGWTGGDKGEFELQLELVQHEELLAEPESPFHEMVEQEMQKIAESALSWSSVGE